LAECLIVSIDCQAVFAECRICLLWWFIAVTIDIGHCFSDMKRCKLCGDLRTGKFSSTCLL